MRQIIFRETCNYVPRLDTIMIKLFNPFLLRYKNGEFISFLGVVLGLYQTKNIDHEVLIEHLQKLQEIYETISNESKKRKGHYLTPEAQKLNAERRNKIKGLRWFLESQLFREMKDHVQAAEILLDDFKTFGKKIDRAKINDATWMIDRLLSRWKATENLRVAVHTLGIEGWLQNIWQVNHDFNDLRRNKMKVGDKRSNLYPMKQKAKLIYEALTRDTMALIYLSKGVHPYEDIILSLNSLIKRHNTNYKIREGIRKSKKRREGKG